MGVPNLKIRSIEPEDYRAMQALFSLPRVGEYVDTMAMARVSNSMAAAGTGLHRVIGGRPGLS